MLVDMDKDPGNLGVEESLQDIVQRALPTDMHALMQPCSLSCVLNLLIHF